VSEPNGALPCGWTWATVGRLAAPEPHAITDGPFGSNLKTAHYTADGPRVIRLQNIGEGKFIDARVHIAFEHFARLMKHHVYADDIVIAALGDKLPRACMIPSTVGPAIVKADCIRFRPDQRIAIPQFLTWMLNAEPTQRQVAAVVHGVGRPRMNLAEIKEIRLPLPPVSEQIRIVAAIEEQFTRLDAAVTSLHRVRVNLKRYRAAVLKAAVEGRLVPTEAELARADGRSYESGERLLAQLTGNFSASESRQRAAKLPEGWAWTTVSEIGDVQGGIQKQPKRSPREHPFPFLRVANVLRGRLDLTEVHRVELFGNELERLRLECGDLLIVEGNGSPSEIGRMAVWNGAIENCVHQNHIIRVRPRPGVDPAFIEAYWNSPAGSAGVTQVASSTSGLYTLSVAKVSRLPVPVLPSAEQRRIVAEVERRLSAVEVMEAAVEANLKRAERLRQAILKRAFEGRLVPQDPTDEPATALLQRIRAERDAADSASRRGRRNGTARAPRTLIQEALLL